MTTINRQFLLAVLPCVEPQTKFLASLQSLEISKRPRWKFHLPKGTNGRGVRSKRGIRQDRLFSAMHRDTSQTRHCDERLACSHRDFILCGRASLPKSFVAKLVIEKTGGLCGRPLVSIYPRPDALGDKSGTLPPLSNVFNKCRTTRILLDDLHDGFVPRKLTALELLGP